MLSAQREALWSTDARAPGCSVGLYQCFAVLDKVRGALWQMLTSCPGCAADCNSPHLPQRRVRRRGNPLPKALAKPQPSRRQLITWHRRAPRSWARCRLLPCGSFRHSGPPPGQCPKFLLAACSCLCNMPDSPCQRMAVLARKDILLARPSEACTIRRRMCCKRRGWSEHLALRSY